MPTIIYRMEKQLYGTGNYIQYPVINHNGKYEKEGVCVCVCVYIYIYISISISIYIDIDIYICKIESLCYIPETQHCK